MLSSARIPESAVRTWAGWNGATNPTNRTYEIMVTLQDDNDAQGLSADADFTWEAQNT